MRMHRHVYVCLNEYQKWYAHTIASVLQNSSMHCASVTFVLNLFRTMFLHSINIHEIIESVNWLNFIKTNFASEKQCKKAQKPFILGKALCFCLFKKKYLYICVYILIFDLCYGIFCTNSVLMWLIYYSQRHAYAVRIAVIYLSLSLFFLHIAGFSRFSIFSVSVSIVYLLLCISVFL